MILALLALILGILLIIIGLMCCFFYGATHLEETEDERELREWEEKFGK